MSSIIMSQLNESADFIRSKFNRPLSVGLILGSGLGAFADDLKDSVKISYNDIPNFPQNNSHIEGHAGTLVLSEIAPDFSIACMQGRFHYYEGHSMAQVIYPIRVMKQLGVDTLIVTNAAGGLNPEFQTGNLMLITDHLNLMGENPLRGPNIDELGPRFPDMSEAYNLNMQAMAKASAKKLNIELSSGVYAAVSGPSYETPAEVKMIKALGADAVGMSTVPEVLTANHMGIKTLGISCITNLAAGISAHKLSHAEVMESGQRVRDQFISLIQDILKQVNTERKTQKKEVSPS